MAASDVIAQLLVNLRLDSSEFVRGSNVAAGKARALESRMKGFQGRVGSATQALGGLAGAVGGGFLVGGVAAVASELVGLGKKALDSASSIGEVSQQLGVSSKDLQQYRYAASQVGIEQDAMDKSLARLTKSVGLAARNGPTAKFFGDLGINIRDANGHLKTAGDLMPEIAQKLSLIRDPAARAAIEVGLFGKEGQRLEPLLTQGAKGVKALTDEASRLGLVLTPEQIKRADDFADTMSRVGQVVEKKVGAGLANAIGAVVGAIDTGSQKINSFDAKLKEIQDHADQVDKRMGTVSRTEFVNSLNLNATSLKPFEDALAKVIGKANEVDKRFGIPSADTFFTHLISSMNGGEHKADEWSAKLRGALAQIVQDFPGKIDGIAADFERGWARITSSTHRMVQDVAAWLGPKMKAAVAGARSAAQDVGDWFARMHDRVTGHSDVPDMVDEIAVQMQRLDAVMVAPVKSATGKAGDAFRDLRTRTSGLLGDLFPEAKEANETASKLKTLDDALKANIITMSVYAEARDKLANQNLGQSLFKVGADGSDPLAPMDGVDELLNELLATNDNVADSAKKTSSDVIKAYGDMAAGVVQHLGALRDRIKSGDILGTIQTVLDTVLSVVQALGQAGVFGKGAPGSGTSYGGARAKGGPVVPGKSYLVGENGPEFVSFGRKGYVTPPKGAANGNRPYFDLRGAVMTADLVAQMNRIGDVATGRGAVIGTAGGVTAMRQSAAQRIP